MYSIVDVLGYKVFSGHLSDVDLTKKHLLNTFSPNSYGISLSDNEFSVALKKTDVLVLDGMGIAIGSIILHGRNIKKIAGHKHPAVESFVAVPESLSRLKRAVLDFEDLPLAQLRVGNSRARCNDLRGGIDRRPKPPPPGRIKLTQDVVRQ